MSHYTEIKAIIQSIDPAANINLLTGQRIETTALAHSAGAFVFLRFDTWQQDNRKSQGARLTSNQRYNWLFLLPDEWDNLNEDSESAQIADTTDEIIEQMKELANQVFYQWANSNQTIFTGSQEAKPVWTVRPWIRKLGSTMSGVEIELRFNKYESNYC